MKKILGQFGFGKKIGAVDPVESVTNEIPPIVAQPNAHEKQLQDMLSYYMNLSRELAEELSGLKVDLNNAMEDIASKEAVIADLKKRNTTLDKKVSSMKLKISNLQAVENALKSVIAAPPSYQEAT